MEDTKDVMINQSESIYGGQCKTINCSSVETRWGCCFYYLNLANGSSKHISKV